jgi:hypothetical protein
MCFSDGYPGAKYTRDHTIFTAYTLSGTSIVQILGRDYTYETSDAISALATSTAIVSPDPTKITTINSSITIGPSSSWELAIPLSCANNETTGNAIGIFNWTLPWSPDQYQSLVCCDNLLAQWSKASSSFASPPSELFTYRTTTTLAVVHTFTRAVCDGPFTTLCDGVTRALCSPSVSVPLVIREVFQTVLSTQTMSMPIRPFPVPPPSCKITSSDCSQLWEEFLTAAAAERIGKGYLDSDSDSYSENVTLPYAPECSRDEYWSCQRCGFSAATAKFLHWPVIANESHLCPNQVANNTRVAESSFPSAQIMTAHWKNFTLTSPTAYAYFSTLKHDGKCGSTYTNILLPVLRDDVSTLVMVTTIDAENSDVGKLDYRHLAYKTIGSHRVPLVPHSAYVGDEKCLYMSDGCKTVYDDYQPGILYRVYPGELRSIDPAWKHCSHQQFAAFDPPIALTPMPVELPKVTLPIIAAFPTVLMEPLPFHSFPPQTAADADPKPGATQEGPYAMQTEQAQPMHLVGSPRPVPHTEPGVVVSRVSVFTVLATLGAVRGSESHGTLAKNDAHRRSSADSVGQSQHFKGGSLPGGSALEDALPNMIPAPLSPGDSSPKAGSKPTGREAVFTQSGRTHTAQQLSPGTFVVDGSMISAGGAPITMNGAIVSAIDSGVVVQKNAIPDDGSNPSTIISDGERWSDNGNTQMGTGTATSGKGKGKKSGAIRATLAGITLGWTIILSACAVGIMF